MEKVEFTIANHDVAEANVIRFLANERRVMDPKIKRDDDGYLHVACNCKNLDHRNLITDMARRHFGDLVDIR